MVTYSPVPPMLWTQYREDAHLYLLTDGMVDWRADLNKWISGSERPLHGGRVCVCVCVCVCVLVLGRGRQHGTLGEESVLCLEVMKGSWCRQQDIYVFISIYSFFSAVSHKSTVRRAAGRVNKGVEPG